MLNGLGGADMMQGGTGGDAYFVDSAGDVVVENAGEGIDAVYASASHALAANVENLYLQGVDDLVGTGKHAEQHRAAQRQPRLAHADGLDLLGNLRGGVGVEIEDGRHESAAVCGGLSAVSMLT